MPKKDGTGPRGQETGTGKGSGCARVGKNKRGCGRAKGRGAVQGSTKNTGNSRSGATNNP